MIAPNSTHDCKGLLTLPSSVLCPQLDYTCFLTLRSTFPHNSYTWFCTVCNLTAPVFTLWLSVCTFSLHTISLLTCFHTMHSTIYALLLYMFLHDSFACFYTSALFPQDTSLCVYTTPSPVSAWELHQFSNCGSTCLRTFPSPVPTLRLHLFPYCTVPLFVSTLKLPWFPL